MGLDVIAYSNLEYREQYVEEKHEDIFDEDNVVVLYVNSKQYPKQSENLINQGIYTYNGYDSWRAGSYSSYNVFRNTLAKVAGYIGRHDPEFNEINYCSDLWDGTIPEGPFYELINFSDCEGAINTECCIKLLNDFKIYAEVALNYEGEYAESFKRVYLLFLNGLNIAADKGCLRFS